MSCEAMRGAIGAYVVGALDEAGSSDVRAHLAQCAACRAEHDQLAGLPDLLRLVPLDALDDDRPAAPPGVLERALAGVAAERAADQAAPPAGGGRGRRRSRGGCDHGDPGGSTEARTSAGPTAVLVAEDAGTGVHGRGRRARRRLGAACSRCAWTDVRGGERCSPRRVDRSGGRETAATWAVPAGGYRSGRSHLEVPGGVSFKPATSTASRW
jgi:hypothetical protein